MKKMVIRNEEINIPDYYEQVETKLSEPKDSVVFQYATENASCFVIGYPKDYSQSLPRTKSELIEGIRHYLGNNQGLIQVEAEKDYVFSIVKELKEPSGVQYIMTYQRFCPEYIVHIQGVFDEINMTGIRDTTILEMCLSNNLVSINKETLEGWTHDPYDETITEGALMNISEEEDFDELFPGFPLTICRELIQTFNKKI